MAHFEAQIDEIFFNIYAKQYLSDEQSLEKDRIVVCRYYGGTRTSEERRARDWDRDKMVRDYVRTGRGWSQPANTGNGGTAANGVNGVMAGGRRLPRTPHTGAINAMAALQGMLGINQNNLSTVLSMHGSVPNISNINNSISNVSGVAQPFGLMSSAVRRLPQVPPAGPAPGQLGGGEGGAGAGQGGWLSKLFKRSSATPQQETNARLQQQLLANTQQSSQHQQHILAAAGPGGVVGGVVAPVYPPTSAPQLLPAAPPQTLLPQVAVPQPAPALVPAPPTQPTKKPGEGWGGRGARLPKVPVPLPSLPPALQTGAASPGQEEEDLFLDRMVAVGRGSRRLPNPADAKSLRAGKRLTRQNGVFAADFEAVQVTSASRVNGYKMHNAMVPMPRLNNCFF